MMKMEPGVQTYFEWLAANMLPEARIGVDPSQVSVAGFRNRSKYFKEKGFEMVTIVENLVDLVWGSEKPPLPTAKVFVHELQYSGASVHEKFEKITKKVADKKIDVLLMTTLDDIDWITNLRGNDIKFNPVFFAYALFFPGEEARLQLFIDQSKLADVQ